MHTIVGVLHTESQDVSMFFERYLYNNTDFFQIEDIAMEEDLRIFAARAGFASWEEYASAEGFEYDHYEDRWVKYSNPLGECDYFYVCDRGLTDYRGAETGSMKIEHVDLSKPIPATWFIRAYADNDELLENDWEGQSLKSAIIEAQKWEAVDFGEDVVLTLINMHS